MTEEQFIGYLDNRGLKYLLDNYIAKKTETTGALTEAKNYADDAIAALVNGAPETLDTLDELAAALKDNKDIVDVLNQSISAKADKSALAAVATSGSYEDLINKPSIPAVGYTANGKNYPVELSNNQMYVNVPWTDTIYTLTKDQVVNALGYEPPTTDTNTTYSAATTSSDGLMSAADKAKLDGIVAGANKYTLPAASADMLGGVRIGYTESGKNYPVKLDGDNKMYVYVPWEKGSSDITGTVQINQGGTGATTAEQALTNLGAAPASHDHNWISGAASRLQNISISTASLDVSMNQTPIIWAKNNGKTSWSLERYAATENTMAAHYYDADGNWTTSGILLDHNNFTTYVTPSAIGAMPAYPGSIELIPGASSNIGGFIDFHFNNSSSDYTSRIIEYDSGVLSVNEHAYVRLGTVTGGIWNGSAIPVANGGTGATDRVGAWRGINSLGTNPISTNATDTTTEWGNLGPGMAWYDTASLLNQQPSTWGILLNYTYGSDIFQIWNAQNGGPTYLRSGNASGWNNGWRQVLDTFNFTSIVTPAAIGAVTSSSLAKVATSGNYNDLTNKPTIPTTMAWGSITGKPTFATVATSGNYNDLSNKPATFAPSTHTHPISEINNIIIATSKPTTVTNGALLFVYSN